MSIPYFYTSSQMLKAYNNTSSPADRLKGIIYTYKHGDRRAIVVSSAQTPINMYDIFKSQYYRKTRSDAERTVRIQVIDIREDEHPVLNPFYTYTVVMPEHRVTTAYQYDYSNPNIGKIPILDAYTARFARSHIKIRDIRKQIPRYDGTDGQSRFPPGANLKVLDRQTLHDTIRLLHDPEIKEMFTRIVELMP